MYVLKLCNDIVGVPFFLQSGVIARQHDIKIHMGALSWRQLNLISCWNMVCWHLWGGERRWGWKEKWQGVNRSL